jgi:hypothetical protein
MTEMSFLDSSSNHRTGYSFFAPKMYLKKEVAHTLYLTCTFKQKNQTYKKILNRKISDINQSLFNSPVVNIFVGLHSVELKILAQLFHYRFKVT